MGIRKFRLFVVGLKVSPVAPLRNFVRQLDALAIPPHPKDDQRSHDCDEIICDRHRSKACRNANMKAKKGARDANQGRGQVAGACSKPAAPLASNSQPRNNADKCHNEEDLQGSGHFGLSIVGRLASGSGASYTACEKPKQAWPMEHAHVELPVGHRCRLRQATCLVRSPAVIRE